MLNQLKALIAAMFFAGTLHAQPSVLHITTGKTTSLVFPAAIIHVDVGSNGLLVAQPPPADHILFIKAAIKYFEATNLSVITAGGKIYSFSVDYKDTPDAMVVYVPEEKENEVVYYAGQIKSSAQKRRFTSRQKGGLSATVTGIFTGGINLFLRADLENQSPVNYDTDHVRFLIKDKKVSQRTAIQELEINPVYVDGALEKISAGQKKTIVFALPKFTLGDDRYLSVYFREKDGGRNLELKLTNKKLLQAAPLLPRE